MGAAYFYHLTQRPLEVTLPLLLGKALQAGKDDAAIATLRSNAIGVGGEKLMPATRKLVELAVIDFLHENKAVLPQYLLPEKSRKSKD